MKNHNSTVLINTSEKITQIKQTKNKNDWANNQKFFEQPKS